MRFFELHISSNSKVTSKRAIFWRKGFDDIDVQAFGGQEFFFSCGIGA